MENVTDADIQHYEGLVRKTAARYVHRTEEEYEDLCSILRIKAWRALVAFDPAKSKQGQESYVFSCVTNQVKDCLKKKKHNLLFIEDIAQGQRGQEDDMGGATSRDIFDSHYLNVSAEDAFKEVEDELPELHSSLTEQERRIVHLLYLDFDQSEISAMLTISRKEVGTRVKSIREKMADWKPQAPDQSAADPAPVVALPAPGTHERPEQTAPSLSLAA